MVTTLPLWCKYKICHPCAVIIVFFSIHQTLLNHRSTNNHSNNDANSQEHLLEDNTSRAKFACEMESKKLKVLTE